MKTALYGYAVSHTKSYHPRRVSKNSNQAIHPICSLRGQPFRPSLSMHARLQAMLLSSLSPQKSFLNVHAALKTEGIFERGLSLSLITLGG